MSKEEARAIYNFLNTTSAKSFTMIILGLCIFIIPDILSAILGVKFSEYKNSFLTISGIFIYIAGIFFLIDNRINVWKTQRKKR